MLRNTSSRVALLIWLTVQVVTIGYTNEPPLQPFYLLLGAAITVVGIGWVVAVGPTALRRGMSTT